MKQIKFKKTFWMNVVLFILITLGNLFLFFVSIDYDKTRLSEKIFEFILLVTLLLTMITLCRDNLGKVSLTFNLLVLVMMCLFYFRNFYRYSEYPTFELLIWLIPFLINVKVLYRINTKKFSI